MFQRIRRPTAKKESKTKFQPNHSSKCWQVLQAIAIICLVLILIKLGFQLSENKRLSTVEYLLQQRMQPPDYAALHDKYYNFSPKLTMWFQEAYRELGSENSVSVNHDYAIFPRSFYKRMDKLLSKNKNGKEFNYCFLGGLKTDKKTFKNRYWILDFIFKHFDSSSYLLFTDREIKRGYKPMGSFDKTLLVDGFVPKYVPVSKRNKVDENYYSVLSKCKFCLAPAGDNLFSMRFYEALAAECIPIVNAVEETYRSKAESSLPYKFYLANTLLKEPNNTHESSTDIHSNRPRDVFEYRMDWVQENKNLFMKYHTLASLPENVAIPSQV